MPRRIKARPVAGAVPRVFRAVVAERAAEMRTAAGEGEQTRYALIFGTHRVKFYPGSSIPAEVVMPHSPKPVATNTSGMAGL